MNWSCMVFTWGLQWGARENVRLRFVVEPLTVWPLWIDSLMEERNLLMSGSLFLQSGLPRCHGEQLFLWRSKAAAKTHCWAQSPHYSDFCCHQTQIRHIISINWVDSGKLAFIENKIRHDASPQQLALAPTCRKGKWLGKQELWRLHQYNGSHQKFKKWQDHFPHRGPQQHCYSCRQLGGSSSSTAAKHLGAPTTTQLW